MNFGTKLLIFTLISINAYAQSSSYSAQDSFNIIKKLVGTWKVKDSESDFRINFELTANNTVLMETWLFQGNKHSLTVYHLDGKRLIATHYCPQGNQPRLEMTGSSKEGKIEFKFFDATNLSNSEASHQHYLAFVIANESKYIERIETYLKSNEKNTDKLLLERDD